MPPQNNKDKMVSIRFQDSELKQLDQQANAVNLSRSAYITRKLQGLPVRTARVPPVNWDTYRELGAISSSLSALAKNIHQIQNVLTMANQQGQPIPRSLPSPDDLRNIISDIEQLSQILKQVRLELSGVIIKSEVSQ